MHQNSVEDKKIQKLLADMFGTEQSIERTQEED